MKLQVRSSHSLVPFNSSALHILSLVSFVVTMTFGAVSSSANGEMRTYPECVQKFKLTADPANFNRDETLQYQVCMQLPNEEPGKAEPATTNSGGSGGADQACEDAHSTASTICLEPETTMGIAMGTSVVAGLTSMMQGSSGTAETCKNQSTIGGLVALLNGGWAAACGTLTYRCRSACAQPENPNATWNPGNKSHFADCKQYYNSAMALAGMAASFAAYTASAKNCEKAANLADSQCLTPESMQRPECRDFCARNPTSPVCVKVDCNDPTQQASNPKCMTFKTPNGPLNPGGPGNFGGGGNSYSSNNPGSFSDPLDDILGGNQFKGGPAVPSTTTNKGVPGGGGGGGLGGGGGGAAASRGGGGGGQPPSITTDGGSAGASGGGGGGGGGFSGGNGGYGNNAAAGGKEKFNLNDYLPFGKLDPKRKLAALQVNQPGGVSGANGLSNWEKVSRRMQVMRGKLQK